MVTDGAGRVFHPGRKNRRTRFRVRQLAGQNKTFRLGGDRRAFTCEFPLDALGAGKEKLALTNADGKRTLYVQTKVESRPRGGAE